MKYLRQATLLLDVSAFGVLMLVPLAGPLELSDVEVTPAAIGGLIYLAVPLALASVAIGAMLAGRVSPDRSTLVGTAFWACALGVTLAAVMAVQAIIESQTASIRGFSLIAVAVFGLNLMVLWRSAFASSPPKSAP